MRLGKWVCDVSDICYTLQVSHRDSFKLQWRKCWGRTVAIMFFGGRRGVQGGRWLSELFDLQLVDFFFFFSCIFGYLPKRAVDNFHLFWCQHVISGWSAFAFGGRGGDEPANDTECNNTLLKMRILAFCMYIPIKTTKYTHCEHGLIYSVNKLWIYRE